MLRDGFVWDEESIPEHIKSGIRKVLMDDWDPIGVRDIPEASDEYDSYIPKIHHLLKSNASVSDIQDYLYEVVSERMELSPPLDREQMRSAAEALKRFLF
jgi:hypothetical protein